MVSSNTSPTLLFYPIRPIKMTILTTSITVISIAILGALFIALRGKSGEQKSIRILVFGVYFWVLIFIQMIIVGLTYQYFK